MRRAPLALAALGLACSEPAPAETRYVVVTLRPAPGPAKILGAAKVTVRRGGADVAELCVRLPARGAEASVALTRAAKADPTTPYEVEVLSFESLSNATNVDPGEEFGCPVGAIPPPATEPQVLRAFFCTERAVQLVFNLGLDCGCKEGQTCSAGVSTQGPCQPGSCCASDIPDPCNLPAL